MGKIKNNPHAVEPLGQDRGDGRDELGRMRKALTRNSAERMREVQKVAAALHSEKGWSVRQWARHLVQQYSLAELKRIVKDEGGRKKMRVNHLLAIEMIEAAAEEMDDPNDKMELIRKFNAETWGAPKQFLELDNKTETSNTIIRLEGIDDNTPVDAGNEGVGQGSDQAESDKS